MPALAANQQFCRSCGKIISSLAPACPYCGTPAGIVGVPLGGSPKSRLAALLLCVFFGWLGVHRFYVDKVGTGILQFLTCGGFGIWWLIDLLLIILGAFEDKQGRRLRVWLD